MTTSRSRVLDTDFRAFAGPDLDIVVPWRRIS